MVEEDTKNKESPITNGISITSAQIAAKGWGLKSRCVPFEKGSVNMKIIPAATIKNTQKDTAREALTAQDEELSL